MLGLSHHSPLWPGAPLALASAALFGATAPASKALLGSIEPWLLAGLLYLGAGIGLGVVQMLRVRLTPGAEAPLRRADLPWLALAIFFGGICGPVLLMLGLSLTSASSGALLLNLEGVATLAIAWVVFRENVDRRLFLGAAAILAGAAVLSWDGEGLALEPGALLIGAACLAWGIDNNLTRKIAAADPVAIATIKGLAAGTVNTALAFAAGANLPGLPVIAAGAATGFFGIGVSLVLFMLALRHLGTARTGAYYALAPFIGAILALLLLPGEEPTLVLVGAGALMAFGLWMHVSERHQHEHEHKAIEHEHRHVHDEHHRHVHEPPVTGAHSHLHKHEPMRHSHPHYPDIHHRHGHG